MTDEDQTPEPEVNPRVLENVYAKMAWIQSKAPRLRKDGEMEMGGGKKLKFLGIDTILDAIRPLLVKANVIVLPTLVEHDSHIKYGQEPPSEIDPDRWSGKIPTKSIREKVVYDFSFVDADNPESQLTVRVSGEAMDTQDKSSGKAFTSAFKSALIKTFALVTGDPEIEDGLGEEPADEKKDRGAQHREQARPSTAKKAAAKPAPTETENAAEAPAEAAAAQDAPATEPPLEVSKQEQALRDAKKALSSANFRLGELRGLVGEDDKPAPGLTSEEINTLAADVTGGKTRDRWIKLPSDLKKITKAVEGLIAEHEANL